MTEIRNCESCKQDFQIYPEDFVFYGKMKVPAPMWCPKCRLQRRASWRNERALFPATCQKCQKKTISVYPPESGITIYCRPCWWSDSWDGLEYGVDFDPSRQFLEQVKNLLYRVPLPDLFGLYTTLENSEYTNMVGYLKNCYFLTMADWDENCCYGSNVFHCKDSYESLMLDGSELCYETINCRECYATFFSIDCTKCSQVLFSKNCIGCTDCIGCVNLRNKQHCIYNKQYSKDEYKNLAAKYHPLSRSAIKDLLEKTEKLWLSFPQPYMHERLVEDCTGDYIANSKNTRNSFMVQEMENAKYCMMVLPGKTTEAYDHLHYGIKAQLLYETLQVGNQASNIMACWFVITDVMNAAYSIWGIGVKDVFGTVGLKKKRFCILNKQYSEGDYYALREKIIAQMNSMPYRDSIGREYRFGDFFPSEFSPFSYQISTAHELFPLSDLAVGKEGFRSYSLGRLNPAVTVKVGAIQEFVGKALNSLSKEIFECEHKGSCNERCSTGFKMTISELAFYQQMGLPLPRLCPNCRHYQRLKKRNSLQLWERQCDCHGLLSRDGGYQNVAIHTHGQRSCDNEFETSYRPDSLDIVYCKECYQKEVV